MKKFLSILMVLVFSLSLSACAKTLPFDNNLSLCFTDNKGGWRTDLIIKNDGSFEGLYCKIMPEETGDDYPQGTVEICNFTGSFKKINRLNKYSYKLILDGTNLSDIVGSSWIENETQYISASPYGINGCEEFILYLPETPKEKLSNEFLNWCNYPVPEDSETLFCYGLLNTETGCGFFGK